MELTLLDSVTFVAFIVTANPDPWRHGDGSSRRLGQRVVGWVPDAPIPGPHLNGASRGALYALLGPGRKIDCPYL